MKHDNNGQQKDTLYQGVSGRIKPFVFDEQVADVFPDMIVRSVPGYLASLAIIQTLTAEYARANTQLYDLGCSLGAATLAVRHGVAVEGCRIIAVDNSTAMVNRCRKAVERDQSVVPVRVQEQDLLDTEISNASVVVMNYTLQFIPVELRTDLLTRIRQGMSAGGVLVLSEKVVFDDPDENRCMNELHRRFKLLNGYAELEIAQKRSALENVLLPESQQAHINRLQQAGFTSFTTCMQFLNFITLLARTPGQ